MNTNVKRSESNSKMTEKRDTREEKGQEREQWSQEIRNELKLHCLRTKSIAQATRFLYGTNKDGRLQIPYLVVSTVLLILLIKLVFRCATLLRL